MENNKYLINNIVTEVENGNSIRKVATHYKKNEDEIISILIHFGNKETNKILIEFMEQKLPITEIAEEYKSGKSFKELSKKYDLNASEISYYIYQYLAIIKQEEYYRKNGRIKKDEQLIENEKTDEDENVKEDRKIDSEKKEKQELLQDEYIQIISVY